MSEVEAANDFPSLLARVRAGAEVVIERDAEAVAVLRPAVEEFLAAVAIHPLTTDIARLAGKLDAEQQSRGIVIPLADLLIGATARALDYSVLTVNPRHFQSVPGLPVIQL